MSIKPLGKPKKPKFGGLEAGWLVGWLAGWRGWPTKLQTSKILFWHPSPSCGLVLFNSDKEMMVNHLLAAFSKR